MEFILETNLHDLDSCYNFNCYFNRVYHLSIQPEKRLTEEYFCNHAIYDKGAG